MTAAAPFDAGILAGLLEAARDAEGTARAGELPSPPDLEAAYRTQAARWTARRVPGWKVAVDGSGASLFAPLDPLVTTTSAPWKRSLEIEIAFVLSADLPVRSGRPYARAEVEAAIASVHLGLELVGSRLSEGSAAPFPLFLADALANAGYVLGPPLAEFWVPGTPLRVKAGARTLFDGVAHHSRGDPILPLLAHANRTRGGWGDLEAGQVVTTGALCGVLAVAEPGAVAVTLGATRLVVDLAGRGHCEG